MALPTFQVVPKRRDHSFTVKLTTADGRFKAVPGFSSEHEASAWITQIERLLYEADPRIRPPAREKSGH